MSNMGIYKITNTCNGKIYIGSSIGLISRQQRHFRDLNQNRHDNKHLQSAYNKYGKENFKFEVIECVEDGDPKVREQFWIDKLDVCNPEIGYNICKTANSRLGVKSSEETKNKIRQANVGKKCSKETKRKIGAGNKNKTMTLEQRRTMSDGQKKRIRSQKELDSLLKCSAKFKKKVKNIDTGEVFNSITEAQDFYEINNISPVCRGLRERAGGYRWEYIQIG